MTRAIRLGALAGAVVLLWLLWLVGRTLVDDALISARVAANLAAGHGLVFNPGERVEAYSNLLWVLLLALASLFKAPLDVAAVALSLVGAAVALPATHALARAAKLDPHESALAVGVTALSSPFVAWAGGGLEVTTVAAAYAFSRAALLSEGARSAPRWRAFIPLAALVLLRADGFVLLLVPFAFALGTRDCAPAERRRMLAAVGGALAVALLVFAHRRAYFGAWVPNTYAAKRTTWPVALTAGLRYHVQFARLTPWVVLAPLAFTRRAAAPRLLLLDVVAWAAYLLVVGGDTFAFARFWLPLVPGLAVLVVLGARAFLTRGALVSALVVGALASAAGLFFGDAPVAQMTAAQVAAVGETTGELLAERLPPDARIAANAIGGIGYASERPLVDMLGLADAVIAATPTPRDAERDLAHARANGGYVLGRDPGVIVFGNASGSVEPAYRSDRELAALASFRDRYELVTLPLDALAPVRRRWLPGRCPTPGVDEDVALGQTPNALFGCDYVQTKIPVHLWVRRDLRPRFPR